MVPVIAFPLPEVYILLSYVIKYLLGDIFNPVYFHCDSPSPPYSSTLPSRDLALGSGGSGSDNGGSGWG